MSTSTDVGTPRGEVAAEAMRDDQGGADRVAIHQVAHLASVVTDATWSKYVGVHEGRDEPPALGRVVAVLDRQPHVLDVEVERVAVEQQEEDRDEQQDHQRPPVARGSAGTP